MICQIDINNGIPIYEQISRQVKFAIANGSLLVGEHVPSVREMATSICSMVPRASYPRDQAAKVRRKEKWRYTV